MWEPSSEVVGHKYQVRFPEWFASNDLSDSAAGREADMLVPVVDERSGGTVGRPDFGGDVLDEGATEGDVE